MTEKAAVYKVSELAAQARQLIVTPPEVVSVALRTAGKAAATLEEAKECVQIFLAKEVK